MTTTQPNEHPPFPAPWTVDSYVSAAGEKLFLVRAADQRVIIQPTRDEAFCRAVARSRNEGTDAEAIAFAQSQRDASVRAAYAEVDRVRAHFRAELDRALAVNRKLQDAIVAARETGRVDDLAAWCQPSEGDWTELAERRKGGKPKKKATGQDDAADRSVLH